MKIVEQVDIDGNIVMGYDTSLSAKGLFEKLHDSFPNIHKDDDGMICGEYKDLKYAVRMKNITYLGHPHPLFKKRIQIAGDLQEFYKEAKTKGRIPLLIGVYSYKNNLVFCEFNIEDFVGKKAHNSSAHIYTENIADATTDGYFEKEDYYGNRLTAFAPSSVNAFLDNKINTTIEDVQHDITKSKYDLKNHYGSDKVAEAQSDSLNGIPVEIEQVISDFFSQEQKNWDGITCYREMIKANYKNKFQPEWPGFYLEYEFEKYLQVHNCMYLIRYAQDKSQGGIDLDLFFPTIKMYGDLKAHSSQSRGIQGNDWETIFGIIEEEEKQNHIYYVVCEHNTEKDSEYSYEVTHYWNSAQDKSDLMSYHKRMKHNVNLVKSYNVLL